MQKNILVSIITPVYNGDKYIVDCIQSVLQQSYSQWEMLIVNDGSTDHTEKYVLQFQDPRIRYFSQQNGGVSAARNLALENMKGSFFCFLDADDVMPKDSLLKRLEVFDRDPSLVFVDGKVEIYDSSLQNMLSVWSPVVSGNVFYDLIRLNARCFFGPTWMVKVLPGNRYALETTLTHGEDLYFYITLAQQGKYGYTDACILQYRKSAASAMSNLDGLARGYSSLKSLIRKSLRSKITFTDLVILEFKTRKIMFLPFSDAEISERLFCILSPDRFDMRILFLSYWGATEGLTAATVIPHVQILRKLPDVEHIVFCSIERSGSPVSVVLPEGIAHGQLLSHPQASVLKTKMMDFTAFPKKLVTICNEHKIDLIICRTSLAGALGYLVNRQTKIPYVVESFEPHADYMLESSVWKWYDPRFLIQRFFEEKIKKTASFILPVSHNYESKLIQEGIESHRIILQPCCIDVDRFTFDEAKRKSIRLEYSIPDTAIVGIYVGKFGGIYYDDDAFKLYADAFDFFGEKFHLIILSGDDQAHIKRQISRYQMPTDRVLLKYAAHEEVPSFLCAADFAFSTIKPAPSRKYCSPIKNGEFWANSLPVLLEPGIGDDSTIVQHEGGGEIIDMQSPADAFHALEAKYLGNRNADDIRKLAIKYRHMQLISDSYHTLLGKFKTTD